MVSQMSRRPSTRLLWRSHFPQAIGSQDQHCVQIGVQATARRLGFSDEVRHVRPQIVGRVPDRQFISKRHARCAQMDFYKNSWQFDKKTKISVLRLGIRMQERNAGRKEQLPAVLQVHVADGARHRQRPCDSKQGRAAFAFATAFAAAALGYYSTATAS